MIEFTAEIKNLKSLFKKLSICMSSDPTRYYLNGIALEKFKDEINFVSTNGHKMCVINALNNNDYTLPIEISKQKNFCYIIPRVAIDEFLQVRKHNHDHVKVFIDNGFISFIYGADECARRYKLIDATYPNWRKVVPQKFKPCVSFNPKYIAELCKVMGDNNEVITLQSVSKEKAAISPCVVTNGNAGTTFVIMPKRF